MKGRPDAAGSPATSKPTWWDTKACSATSAFFVGHGWSQGTKATDEAKLAMARPVVCVGNTPMLVRIRRHARVPVAQHPDSPGAPAVQRPLSRHGHQCGRGVQPVEGPGGHPLARGRHVRRVGHVLLSARRRHGRALVVGVSTDEARVEELRGDLRAGPRGISPPRRKHRRAHGNRGVAGRRRRSPPRHADEPFAPDPHHRADQLRGSRPGPAERRPRAPGIQQPVR